MTVPWQCIPDTGNALPPRLLYNLIFIASNKNTLLRPDEHLYIKSPLRIQCSPRGNNVQLLMLWLYQSFFSSPEIRKLSKSEVG